MTRAPRSVLIALVLIALSCGSREEPVSISSEEIDAPREGKTPIEVMENYALAHRTRNIEFYQRLIDPRFDIRMPPGHVSSDEGTGTEYEREMATTGMMFSSAGWIACRFTADPPRPSSVEGYPASDGFQEVVARDLDFRVWVAGTEDTFSVIDDSVLFVLVPDELKTPPTWRIICQQLFPVSGGAR